MNIIDDDFVFYQPTMINSGFSQWLGKGITCRLDDLF